MTNVNFEIFIPLIAGVIGFFLYWKIYKSGKIKDWFDKYYGINSGPVYFVVFSRTLGGLAMGFIPAVVYFIVYPTLNIATGLKDLGLKFPSDTALLSVGLIVALLIPIIPFVIYGAKKPDHLKEYPQMRIKQWNRRIMVINFITWAIYLLGYEFYFRGIILFPLINELGLWQAIAISTIIYAGIHLPKGAGETIGSIPLGVALCLIGYYTGTIWVAFGVHLIMAWINSIFSLKNHPEMQYNNHRKT